MKRQRLALLIPAFNASPFLPRLLASAAAQTEPFDEIWVYDDASTDDTAAVAAAHGAQVVRGEANRGCSFGKNVLAERTSCEWLHFHDADDALLPHFVASARKWLQADGPDVVLFGYEERQHEDGALLAVRRFDDGALRRDPLPYVLQAQPVSIAGIYRRSRFLEAGGFDLDPAVLYHEDVAMHCRLALAGLTFAADGEVTVVNYRRRASMSSGNPVRCLQAQYALARKVAAATGGRYAKELAARLWLTAAGAAAYLDWPTADAAAALAMALAGPLPSAGGGLFRTLCRISVRAALRVRELGIRLSRPSLRRTYPPLLGKGRAGS